VSREQNYFLYELLGWFEVLTGYPILLNTSFNIKGLPILTTVEDAVKSWQETALDYLLIENCLYGK
jgi:carbamoyltransferase